MKDLPTFADVQDAAERLQGHAYLTPLLRNEALDDATGGRVFVKPECLQLTGSFKFRGAFNRLSRLSADEVQAGVVAYSSGNHGQGVAAAARLLGMPAVVVMPSDAPAVKIEATRAQGAEVELYNRATGCREAIAARLADERGAVVVPSFDDFHVIAGQGTVGLEVVGQLAERGLVADALLCPASGGGLMAGINLAFEALSPATATYVVEPIGFEDHRLSLEAGVRTPNGQAGTSLSDALLAPQPGEMTFPINQRRLKGALAVSDAEALEAMAFAFRHLRIVLEPGGAVALAASLSGKLDLVGQTVVIVASGGNVDPELFRRAIDPAVSPG